MKPLITAALLSASLIAPLAQAELVQADWLTAGDNKAAYDTETGLTWLDLTETTELSLLEIQAQLTTTYAGWQLPTRGEVESLMANAFAAVDGGQGAWDVDAGEVSRFTAMLGASFPGANGSYGIYFNSDRQIPEDRLVFSAGAHRSGSNIKAFTGGAPTNDLAWRSEIYGVFLVKGGAGNVVAAPVPTAAGIGALGLGLLGLAGWRRRHGERR